MTNEQLEALREWVREEIVNMGLQSPEDCFNKLKDSFKPDYTKLSKKVCDDHKDK